MIDKDPIETAGRRRRRQKRFPIVNPTCLLCGEPNLECLTPVTLNWIRAHKLLIEIHHVACEQNDSELVVALCLNCHRKVHEGLAQGAITMRGEPDPRKRVAVMLEALVIFLEMLVVSLRRWASLLTQTSDDGESQ